MAVPQRGAESLEAGDVSRQFEDPQDPQDAEDLRGLGDVLERVLGGELVQHQRHEEREDPQQVDHVQEREHERKLKIKYSNLILTLSSKKAPFLDYCKCHIRRTLQLIQILVRVCIIFPSLANCD